VCDANLLQGFGFAFAFVDSAPPLPKIDETEASESKIASTRLRSRPAEGCVCGDGVFLLDVVVFVFVVDVVFVADVVAVAGVAAAVGVLLFEDKEDDAV